MAEFGGYDNICFARVLLRIVAQLLMNITRKKYGIVWYDIMMQRDTIPYHTFSSYETSQKMAR